MDFQGFSRIICVIAKEVDQKLIKISHLLIVFPADWSSYVMQRDVAEVGLDVLILGGADH
jgi:hypothetical protein